MLRCSLSCPALQYVQWMCYIPLHVHEHCSLSCPALLCVLTISLYIVRENYIFKMLLLELPCRQQIDIIKHTYIKSPTSIHLDIYNQQLVLLYYWSKDLFDSLFLHLYHNILQEVMGVEMWLMCYQLNIAEELIQFHMSLAVSYMSVVDFRFSW